MGKQHVLNTFVLQAVDKPIPLIGAFSSKRAKWAENKAELT